MHSSLIPQPDYSSSRMDFSPMFMAKTLQDNSPSHSHYAEILMGIAHSGWSAGPGLQ